jgi:hypothetical protein
MQQDTRATWTELQMSAPQLQNTWDAAHSQTEDRWFTLDIQSIHVADGCTYQLRNGLNPDLCTDYFSARRLARFVLSPWHYTQFASVLMAKCD